MGAGVTTPASAPLHRSNWTPTAPDGQSLGVWVNGETVTTFPFAQGTEFTVTSGYGDRVHPIRGGTRFHAGIDIAPPPGGTPEVRSLAGGEVVRVANTDPNGYGNTVAVRTPDGLVEHYAHLSSFAVYEGEVIQPGQVIGRVGSTGGSTGNHLDFSVWKSQDVLYANPRENTIDPMAYMRSQRSYVSVPLGVGPAPSYSTDSRYGDYSDYRSYYQYEPNRVRTGNTLSSPSVTHTNATPGTTARAALHRNAYGPNNVENNYGYEALANDVEYRQALVFYSNALGIPAQWLADVIDYETAGRHDPGVDNGLGCVGLLQACGTSSQATGGGPGALDDFAQAWGTSARGAFNRLSSMDRARQLQSWHWWLDKYSDGGALINTIEDLYALVNGGPSALRNSDRSGYADSNGPLVEHFRKLGNRAGRRYELTSDRLHSDIGHVHESTVAGCAECSRQVAYFGEVYPHYG